jgi:hypothetical protein
MGAAPGLAADLEKLARENPEGSGPFRQQIGPDLLPAAGPSERAVALSLPAPDVTQRGNGPAPAPAPASVDVVSEAEPREQQAAGAASAAPATNWPPYGAPELKSDTMLKIDASKLHIPREAFVASRAAKAAEREREEKRLASRRHAAFALLIGVVVVFGLWVVRREPPVGAPTELAPAVPSTLQVAAAAAPVATVAVGATAVTAPSSGSPAASASEAPTPAPALASAKPPRRAPPSPGVAPRPPLPIPPATQAPLGPIYD